MSTESKQLLEQIQSKEFLDKVSGMGVENINAELKKINPEAPELTVEDVENFKKECLNGVKALTEEKLDETLSNTVGGNVADFISTHKKGVTIAAATAASVATVTFTAVTALLLHYFGPPTYKNKYDVVAKLGDGITHLKNKFKKKGTDDAGQKEPLLGSSTTDDVPDEYVGNIFV
jgi:hypothetical protein